MKSFKKIWRIGLLWIILLIFAGCTSNAPSEKFSFIFFTDCHVKSELNAKEGFLTAIERMNSIRPRPAFAIGNGDLVFDATACRFERADSLYNMYEECISLLDMTVYNVMGNHEMFGIIDRSGVSTDHPEYGKQMFKNRLGDGKTYRSFDHGNWHFILLDAFVPENNFYKAIIYDEEMEWLKKDLAAVGPERPIVVATHAPMYTITAQLRIGATGGMKPWETIENANELRELFSQYNVKAVLQGHLHHCEEIILYGIRYIMSGAIAAHGWQYADPDAPQGFSLFNVDGEELSWEYIIYDWSFPARQER